VGRRPRGLAAAAARPQRNADPPPLVGAPHATLLVDAAVLRRGLSAAWPALLLQRPQLRLLVLHANLAELPPGATALSGPLDLAALRSALGA
jgi:hypothetical protein